SIPTTLGKFNQEAIRLECIIDPKKNRNSEEQGAPLFNSWIQRIGIARSGYAERSAENERRMQLYDLAITLEPPVMYNISTFF
ncbi:hypothetical protein, partial [uncultured Alcanivorax sp.]|uniref:hypothetical protein n=1 Tax=uncultured Alcanivorax sp. TaxID=191215 RepID=UPI0026249B8C